MEIPAFFLKPPEMRKNRGFALVVTLSLMVLLTIVAVGLLSLSAVSLRTSSKGEAMAQARSNARLSLMLALGELQAALGPDQAISAPAASVFPSAWQPHLTGAWESWHWTPQTSGSPPYNDKANTFKGWLVSTSTPTAAADFNLPAQAPPGDSVELVGDLKNNDVSTSVRAEKVRVSGNKLRGNYAYAVFDENTKAAIHLDRPESMTDAEEIASRTAPPRFRADILAPELVTLKKPEHLLTLQTAIIPAGNAAAPEFDQRFHAFTTHSLGLLTDPVSGGLKTDLTSLMEASSFPEASFPAETPYFSKSEGAPLWKYLYDHYRKYKQLRRVSSGTPEYSVPSSDLQPWRRATATSPVAGVDYAPESERLLPIVAKVQIVFSLVSHHAHITDNNPEKNRVAFLNTKGNPRGNTKHAVPHLAYDPVITLYNPYDVTLSLRNFRVRIWDPPVGFRFVKIADGSETYYRSEMANGEYHGLARFQHKNEKNKAARKWFTLQLTDGTPDRAGSRLTLDPGEVKVFSPRVENNWTWGYETAGGYAVRSFFDWNADNDFGNIDRRTKNEFGIEAVPGWDTRAGLQTDHMSYATRELNTLYDFEKNAAGTAQYNHDVVGGFLSLRLDDGVRVEAKPVRTTGTASNVPDFQVDLLASRAVDVERDVLRSYRFKFADIVEEMSRDPDDPVITREFTVSDTMQYPGDKGPGLKKPFAMLEMGARTTRDQLDDSKAWVYNNPIIEGTEQDHDAVGPANQSYDVRLIPMSSFKSFPGIEFDPLTNRGFFGASKTATEGSSNVPMAHIPVAPAASLGDWIPSNLVASSVLPRVVHPLGNSWAHPLIPSGAVANGPGSGAKLDHSYLLNDALWDKWYFSSITDYSSDIFGGGNRSRREVLRGVFDGSRPALNPRMAPAAVPGDADQLANELSGMTEEERARKLAAHIAIAGAFNVNSASIDAWKALLASLRDRAINAWGNKELSNTDTTPFVRAGFPIAGSAESSETTSADVQGQIRWAGFRTLSDGQINTLAREIVKEIQERGAEDKAPSLSLGEFVNRRPGSSVHANAGLLQTAINNSRINEPYYLLDSKTLNAADIPDARKKGVENTDVMSGNSAEGAPPILTQGDLMEALAGVATVRGDTFKVRGYGEALSPDGKTILASAWCEAVVQRVPEFVDPRDAPETTQSALSSTANQNFGRRFEIISFRWVNPLEI
jgi:type II secretory pathway pseudopilin PulG